LEAAYHGNVYLPVSFWKVILKVAAPAKEVRSFAESVVSICKFAHRNNVPEWKPSTDEAIFNGMERNQHWQLGILLGVINPADEEPQCKALPDELRAKILDALQKA
ncbi:MAG: hypothetical protein IK119_01335, partial [Bacteroidales bacterium]|nr:hypothetical protein [Bacteroidales bacterium]